MLLNLFLGVTMILVLWLGAREITAYRLGRGTLPLRRLTLRLATTGMLLFLLVSIFLAVRVFDLATPHALPKHWMAFWGSLLLLASGILCMVVGDLRMMRDTTRTETNTVWRDIAAILATHAKAPRDDDATPTDTP